MRPISMTLPQSTSILPVMVLRTSRKLVGRTKPLVADALNRELLGALYIPGGQAIYGTETPLTAKHGDHLGDDIASEVEPEHC